MRIPYKTLLGGWNYYRNETISSNTPTDQLYARMETFYAGASVMFDLLTEIGRMSDDDAGMEKIESLRKELQIFVEGMVQHVSNRRPS